MGALLTFCIPVGGYHTHLIDRALQQVDKQTIPCEASVYIDNERRGAGYSRNRAVEKASTPFVAFLDCDDYLDPTYAEKMLSAYKPGHYVYSDFYMAGEWVKMSDCSNLKDDDAHHLVTCVIHRDIFWQVGGFDEKRNLEDTLFYAKCLFHGVCGIRCPYPLVEYTGDGQRSAQARQVEGWAKQFWDIFREYPSMCCGKGAVAVNDMGTQHEGDVLVRTLWGGNRSVHGRVTNRRYPRSGNGKELWLDPRDAAAQPDLFQIIPQIKPEDYEPALALVQELVAEKLKVAVNAQQPAPASVDSNPVPSKAPEHRAASDVQRNPTKRGKVASPNRGRRK